MSMRPPFSKSANQTENQQLMESAYCPYLIWKILKSDAPNYAIDESIWNCLQKIYNQIRIATLDALFKFNAVENHFKLKIIRTATLKNLFCIRDCSGVYMIFICSEIKSTNYGGLLMSIVNYYFTFWNVCVRWNEPFRMEYDNRSSTIRSISSID